MVLHNPTPPEQQPQLCPFCGHPGFVVHRRIHRWGCEVCKASGTIEWWPGRQMVTEPHPLDPKDIRGFG